MAGTVAGGKAAAETNKAKYGGNFYALIGSRGGKKGHTGGFYANRELASLAGSKGGKLAKGTWTEIDESRYKEAMRSLHDKS